MWQGKKEDVGKKQCFWAGICLIKNNQQRLEVNEVDELLLSNSQKIVRNALEAKDDATWRAALEEAFWVCEVEKEKMILAKNIAKLCKRKKDRWKWLELCNGDDPEVEFFKFYARKYAEGVEMDEMLSWNHLKRSASLGMKQAKEMLESDRLYRAYEYRMVREHHRMCALTLICCKKYGEEESLLSALPMDVVRLIAKEIYAHRLLRCPKNALVFTPTLEEIVTGDLSEEEWENVKETFEKQSKEELKCYVLELLQKFPKLGKFRFRIKENISLFSNASAIFSLAEELLSNNMEKWNAFLLDSCQLFEQYPNCPVSVPNFLLYPDYLSLARQEWSIGYGDCVLPFVPADKREGPLEDPWKQMIGEQLYVKVQSLIRYTPGAVAEHCGKYTGMFLELSQAELALILHNTYQLVLKIQEAELVLIVTNMSKNFTL